MFAHLSRPELLKLAPQYQWVHSINLGDGVITRGRWGAGNPSIRKAMDDISFAGKKVLDIGCWDGLYTFLAEQRGAAEVYATDLINQRDHAADPTFQLAQAALHSSARYYPDLSVYDVDRLGVRDFDVVLFMGVYYHLKDPLRALTCLRRVMREGALLLVEGAVLRRRGCFANFYYQNTFRGDRSNWWVPTPECLRQWVTCSFFQVAKEYDRWGRGDNRRHTLLARAVSREDPLYLRPAEGLEQYARAKA